MCLAIKKTLKLNVEGGSIECQKGKSLSEGTVIQAGRVTHRFEYVALFTDLPLSFFLNTSSDT